MHEKVIGQDEAVSLICQCLGRARVEMRSKNKTIANFLFFGSNGCVEKLS
jgi:ATP-dependent Clp protease ATP-binding subunit ClpA